MTFYDQLCKETAPHRQALYSVAQLADALQGRINTDTYISYLTQAYHHVKHTVPLLMSMGGRLGPDRPMLLNAIADYIREEIGHEEWILNDIEAAGGDKNKARNSLPHPETERMVAYNYDYIHRKNPVGFLGMVFMLESTSVEIASRGAEAVMHGLDLPSNAFTYLFPTAHWMLIIWPFTSLLSPN